MRFTWPWDRRWSRWMVSQISPWHVSAYTIPPSGRNGRCRSGNSMAWQSSYWGAWRDLWILFPRSSKALNILLDLCFRVISESLQSFSVEFLSIIIFEDHGALNWSDPRRHVWFIHAQSCTYAMHIDRASLRCISEPAPIIQIAPGSLLMLLGVGLYGKWIEEASAIHSSRFGILGWYSSLFG